MLLGYAATLLLMTDYELPRMPLHVLPGRTTVTKHGKVVTNKQGKVKVWVVDLKTGKKKKINKTL